jgi:hypothetical protein
MDAARSWSTRLGGPAGREGDDDFENPGRPDLREAWNGRVDGSGGDGGWLAEITGKGSTASLKC